MLKRSIALPASNSFFLFGPRQTGKSTLLKSLFPRDTTLYYDLLLSEEYRRLLARPALFREEVLSRDRRITHVVVDEVQRVPELLNEIHSLMESPGSSVFCLSGSSARKLKRCHANMLAGRAWTYRLHPFTHAELGGRFSLQKALAYGTLPPVYFEEDREAAVRTLKSYAETYLKEEIEAESLLRNVSAFYRFLPLASGENGNIINFSALSRETGTSYKTVQEYFKILEDTLVGFLLYPHCGSERKRLVKHPKFYFFDTGVARALAGNLSSPADPGTPEYGRLFEHFIGLELLRFKDYLEKDFKLSFFRTDSGAEVDFIIERPDGKTFAIEVKSSTDPGPGSLRGLRSFAETKPDAVLYCACTAPRARSIGAIRLLPWQDLFENIFK